MSDCMHKTDSLSIQSGIESPNVISSISMRFDKPHKRHMRLRLRFKLKLAPHKASRILTRSASSPAIQQHGFSATAMHSTETLMSLHQLSSWAIGASRRARNRSDSIEMISAEDFHRSTSANGVNGQAPVAIMQSTVNENANVKVTRVSTAWCIGPTNFTFPSDRKYY